MISTTIKRVIRQFVAMPYIGWPLKKLLIIRSAWRAKLAFRKFEREKHQAILTGYGVAIKGMESVLQRHEALLQALTSSLIKNTNEQIASKSEPLQSHPRVSLIINTYNRMASLPVTLRALEFLRYPELEVIVVNGPSTDGTYEYLQTHWQNKIKIISCDVASLGKARNIGVQNASGDIICFVDDDGIPEPDWLDKLIAAYNDPKMGAAGGWVRDHTGVGYQTKWLVSKRDGTSEVVDDVALVPPSKPFSDQFPGLIGVNSSYRKSVLLEVGGFDEEYTYHLEETDLLVRIIDAGYHVKMIPEAEVHHKCAPSHIRFQNGKVHFWRSWFQIVKSTAYYILKNATPHATLPWCIETIQRHKQKLIDNTYSYLAQNWVDQTRCTELLAEIEAGAKQGIFDAFERPIRHLLTPYTETPWKNFPRPLASINRLRMAFVMLAFPWKSNDSAVLFLRNLAKQLAEFGHEITVIIPAEAGQAHTVDFEEGVWVHRLPNDDSVAVATAESLSEMPNPLRKMAGRALAELNRINSRRSLHYVTGIVSDLDNVAVLTSLTGI